MICYFPCQVLATVPDRGLTKTFSKFDISNSCNLWFDHWVLNWNFSRKFSRNLVKVPAGSLGRSQSNLGLGQTLPKLNFVKNSNSGFTLVFPKLNFYKVMFSQAIQSFSSRLNTVFPSYISFPIVWSKL